MNNHKLYNLFEIIKKYFSWQKVSMWVGFFCPCLDDTSSALFIWFGELNSV